MLLHDAEKQDANINAEVSFMENYKALEELKQFEEEKESFTLPSMVNKVSKMASKLPTLLDKDENKELQFLNKQLTSENESLKKKIAFQEQKLISSLKEKSTLSNNLKETESESSQLKSELEGNIVMSAGEKQALEDKVQKYAKEITEYKKQLNTKISKLKQVEAMKKMLMDKNTEIKTLREKLANYE